MRRQRAITASADDNYAVSTGLTELGVVPYEEPGRHKWGKAGQRSLAPGMANQNQGATGDVLFSCLKCLDEYGKLIEGGWCQV